VDKATEHTLAASPCSGSCPLHPMNLHGLIHSWVGHCTVISCCIMAVKARTAFRLLPVVDMAKGFPRPYTSGTLSFIPIRKLDRCPIHLSKETYSGMRTFIRSSTTTPTAPEEDDNVADNHGTYSKTLSSSWNIPGLRQEVQRQILRCHKKIAKVSDRIQSSQATIHHLRTHPNVTLEELEACPNIQLYESESKLLQHRLGLLNQLHLQLQTIKMSKNITTLPLDMATLALELQCEDEPPSRSLRGPKKEKGPKAHSVPRRKPYKCYYTVNQTEIRVRWTVSPTGFFFFFNPLYTTLSP
jgi:hypothetical protein